MGEYEFSGRCFLAIFKFGFICVLCYFVICLLINNLLTLNNDRMILNLAI